jgi:hypothetical protein
MKLGNVSAQDIAIVAVLIIKFSANLLLEWLLCAHHTKPVPVDRLKPRTLAESLETLLWLHQGYLNFYLLNKKNTDR